MKNLLLVFALLPIFSLPAYSQPFFVSLSPYSMSLKDMRDETKSAKLIYEVLDVEGKVSSIKIENAQLIRQLSEQEKYVESHRKYFNTIYFDPEGKINRIEPEGYKCGNISDTVQIIRNIDSDIGKQEILFSYDNYGKFERKELHQYDRNGNKISVVTFNFNREITSSVKMEYDHAARLIDLKTYSKFGGLEIREVFARNSKGDVTGWKRFLRDEQLPDAHWTATYEYDARRNWVKRERCYQSRMDIPIKTTEIDYRTITYFLN